VVEVLDLFVVGVTVVVVGVEVDALVVVVVTVVGSVVVVTVLVGATVFGFPSLSTRAMQIGRRKPPSTDFNAPLPWLRGFVLTHNDGSVRAVSR